MELDTLDNTEWDVLIAGTGLHESLLALALSRSGKRIVHVDDNKYYGSSYAALSLQDAEEWAKKFSAATSLSIFSNACVTKPPEQSSGESRQLGFSRAYSLALAPQIIYASSALLPSLVSSRVDSQLEFVAVGSCFVFTQPEETGSHDDSSVGSLLRVPSSREDIFADTSLEPRHKRGLMKFIKFVIDFEDQTDLWEQNQSTPFDEFLSKHFNLSPAVQQPLHALTLSNSVPEQTLTKFAVPRIARHLRSIGVFGPGFGAVIPKWGGLAEIVQVGCRAAAVGGTVYMLGNGIDTITSDPATDSNNWHIRLKNGEQVSAGWIISGRDNVSSEQMTLLGGVQRSHNQATQTTSRLIAIVSSPMTQLFPQTVEGSPVPTTAIVRFPDSNKLSNSSNEEFHPVHIMIHSSESGECPTGQCVLYGSVACGSEPGYTILDQAVTSLLKSISETDAPEVLWKLQYEHHLRDVPATFDQSQDSESQQKAIVFPQSSLDLAYDDEVLRSVRRAWQRIMGPDDAVDFMTFAPRDTLDEDQ